MENNKPGDGIKQQSDRETLSSLSLKHEPSSSEAQPVSSQPQSKKIEDLEDSIRKAERVMIRLTAAIAFFGLCSVVVAFLQWQAMRGQLDEMKSSSAQTDRIIAEMSRQARYTNTLAGETGKIAGEAKRSADTAVGALATSKGILGVAQQNLGTTRTAIELEHRANVGVSIVQLTNFEAGKIMEATVTFTNAGKANASGVHGVLQFKAFFNELRPPFEYTEADAIPTSTNMLPTMVAHLTAKFPIPLTETDISLYDNGKIGMYIWGTVWYKDRFGKHYSNFCFERTKAYGNDFASCTYHNDTDDENQGKPWQPWKDSKH